MPTFRCASRTQEYCSYVDSRARHNAGKVILGLALNVGGIGGVVWELANRYSAWSLEVALVAAWIAACFAAKQYAAWVLVGPTVDHETHETMGKSMFLKSSLAGLSLDCPELLTFTSGLVLMGIAWALSLFVLSLCQVGLTWWPLAYAVSVHLTWVAWHFLMVMFLPWPDPEHSWRATFRAVRVFTTYDVYNLRAGGLFRFPTRWLRLTWSRWAFLVVLLGVIGFGFGVNCPNPFLAPQQGSSVTVQLVLNLVLTCLAGPTVFCSTLWLVAGTTLARFEKELSHHRDPDTTDWDNYVDRMINSNDELERDHLLIGTSETADYPVMVHRAIHDQHGHVFGRQRIKQNCARHGTTSDPTDCPCRLDRRDR